MRKSSFPPVADARTRVLILGSLPGEASLERAQYYAHPQNQFWRLAGGVIGRDLPAGYSERLAALLSAGIGLWDVIESATRNGSLDGAIRDHRPNALEDLVARLPGLRVVAFNGARAAGIGRRRLSEATSFAQVALPSSSPAYTLAFERKLAAWLPLQAFLDPDG